MFFVCTWPPTKTIKKDYFSTLQKTICVLLQGGKEWTTCTYYWKLFALKENLVQILLLMDCGKKCCVKNRGIIRGDILLGTQESIYLILWQDDLLCILFYTQFMHDRIGTWKLNLTPQFGRSLTIDKFLSNSGWCNPFDSLREYF